MPEAAVPDVAVPTPDVVAPAVAGARAGAMRQIDRAEHDPVGGDSGPGRPDPERRYRRLLNDFDVQTVGHPRARVTARTIGYWATAASRAAGLTSSVLIFRAAPVSAVSIAPRSRPGPAASPSIRTCSTAISEE